MNWGGWRDFLHMGGYARYVWGAYGVVALAVIIELVGVRMRLMRRQVRDRNVYRWAGHLLFDAARLRRRQRILEFADLYCDTG